jgi:hypothetical protein
MAPEELAAEISTRAVDWDSLPEYKQRKRNSN